jgi:RNA polymerase sigma factor (sigma-70 family)
MKVRQDHIFSQISIQIDFHSPDRVVQDSELAETINSSIANLPEKCRKIFCMNRFEHLTYKEIARIQGVTVKAVEK